MLEAVVQFRVRDFAKGSNIDADRQFGIGRRIVERLAAAIAEDAKLDLTNLEFLKRVEKEVHLHAVPHTAWMQLACLANEKEFNPKHAIIVEFTDDKGSHSHGSTIIASLQAAFPFWQILNIHRLPAAKLSSDALHGLEVYSSRQILPEVKYEIAENVPQFGQLSGTNTLVLPAEWRPKSK